MVSIKDINRAVGSIIGDKDSEDTRPVIAVGHDIAQDLRYLMKIGYNPWRVPHIVDEIDTKDIFQRIERDSNGRGLATICHELGIPGHNYHNAGNDAVYTLQAMIAMAVKRTVEGSDRQEESFTPG
jgi:DNA polymerase III epsilon subunit-like protein